MDYKFRWNIYLNILQYSYVLTDCIYMIDFVLIQSYLPVCLEQSEISEYIEYSPTQNHKLLADKHISFLL